MKPGDMKAIGSTLDFVGLNIYNAAVCARRRVLAKGWAFEGIKDLLPAHGFIVAPPSTQSASTGGSAM